MIKLNSRDFAVLESHKVIIKGLAVLFGKGCEFVIHSLDSLDSSVIAIENGHISGRVVGSPITDLALEFVHKEKHNSNYLTPYQTSSLGKKTQSITLPIFNGEKLIGLLCANIDLNISLIDFASIFNIHQKSKLSDVSTSIESFYTNVDEMINNSINESISFIQADSNIRNKDKNKAIILRLETKGFFQLKGSVDALAERLQISIHTVYSNLKKNSLKNKEK